MIMRILTLILLILKIFFNDPDVYGSEKILKSRKRQGNFQYLVKLTNYPVSERTWEPEENILDQRLLDDFYNKSK